jgi:peptide/nickel transport system permease protein
MSGQPVSTLVASQVRPTVSLAVAGGLCGVVIGASLGVAAGMGQGSLLGRLSRAITAATMSVPVMFTGTIAIWLFAVRLDWLPATGQGKPAALVLPALVVGITLSGAIARTVDAGITSASGQPFVMLARAKGLSHLQVAVLHSLRVGMLPALETAGLQFAFLLGGAVVTESVFARQGLGRLLLSAVLNKDVPVVQGIVILSAIASGGVTILADIAHAWLDPRVRFGERQP